MISLRVSVYRGVDEAWGKGGKQWVIGRATYVGFPSFHPPRSGSACPAVAKATPHSSKDIHERRGDHGVSSGGSEVV
jgi:hypothetical protein